MNIGPDGLLLVWGVILSLAVTLLAWRRPSLLTASVVTMAVTVSLVAWEFSLVATNPAHRFVATLFIIVPSALLLGASRTRWMTRRPWVLMLLGPVVFVVCFIGICECAYRLLGA
jgi:hypothetical protein